MEIIYSVSHRVVGKDEIMFMKKPQYSASPIQTKVAVEVVLVLVVVIVVIIMSL